MSRDVYVLVLLELWTSSRLYDCVRPCVSLDTVVLPQHCPGVGVPELDASICHAPSRGEQVTLRGQNPGGVCVCGGGAGVRLLHLFKRILSPHSHLVQRLHFIRPTQLTWKGHHASALTAAWCALILCRSLRLASCMHRMLSLPPLASCPPQCDHFSPQTSCVCMLWCE